MVSYKGRRTIKNGWITLCVILFGTFISPFILSWCSVNPDDVFKFGLCERKDFFTLWISSFGVIGLAINIIHSQTRIRLQDKLIRQQEKQGRDNRFAKSVELLGHESESARMGGVYNLRFLAEEFFNEYGDCIFSILSSYVRIITSTLDYQGKYNKKPSNEVQSILNILTIDLSHRKSHINLMNSYLVGANLEKANMGKACLMGTNLKEANLKEATLWYTDLRKANLEKANLEKANLEKANLEKACLVGTNLEKANMENVCLVRANLGGICLDNVNLVKANLEKANLYGANLYGANLYGANLYGANLVEAILWETNLKEVALWKAYLEGAYLVDVNLEGAHLEGVNLKDVNLVGGNFKGVHMESVNLEEAHLKDVNLDEAYLVGIKVEDVDLEETDSKISSEETDFLKTILMAHEDKKWEDSMNVSRKIFKDWYKE